MAVLAIGYAILIGMAGDLGSAAFGILVAAASVGFVVLAGKMRKSDKARADFLSSKIH